MAKNLDYAQNPNSIPDRDKRKSAESLRSQRRTGVEHEMWKKILLVGFALLGVGLIASKVIFPSYVTSPREARARVLATDLATMRALVGQYTLDIGKRPQSLDELVKAGYIKKIPPDPLSGRTDTWVLEWSGDPKTPGIVGIHSAVESR